MMFHGYKTTTKDIDLVFKNNKDMEKFIQSKKGKIQVLFLL